MPKTVEYPARSVYDGCMAKKRTKPEKPKRIDPSWGKRLRALREDTLHLTQEQMAAKLGFTRRSIIAWENGNAEVPLAVCSLVTLLENHAAARKDF